LRNVLRVRRLLARPDFLRLWTGQSVTMLGAQVTGLAIPTLAILRLHAGPMEFGLLSALGFLPSAVLGLFAGVLLDRLPQRPVMIASDVGRLVVLATIPAAYLTGRLGMSQLYAVAFVNGIFGMLFELAYQSYLPRLLAGPELSDGNSSLELSRSGASVVGPAIGGGVIQAIGGPLAVLAGSLSFLLSAAVLSTVERPDDRRKSEVPGRFGAELREGLRVVIGSRILTSIAACTATSNLGAFMFWSVNLLYAYQVLRLTPAQIGIVFAMGNLGFLAGALLAPRLPRRLGLGRTLVLSEALLGLGMLGTPLAAHGDGIVVLAVSQVVINAQVPIYNVNQLTLRQAITPVPLLGRMNATMRTAVLATIPIGSLLGGILGSRLGLGPTLLVGAGIALVAPAWMVASPVLGLRRMPVGQPAAA
jgi:predicted MFS family arabinose efflux permease